MQSLNAYLALFPLFFSVLPSIVDASANKADYTKFYNLIGEKYPESTLVHREKGAGSRFYCVLHELMPYALSGKSLLDVGCNDGVYTLPYALLGGAACGIDISKSLIERASKKAIVLGLKNTEFELADIESYDTHKRFDIILMSEVLEHLLDPAKALRNIRRLLCPKGMLILTVPTPLFEIEKGIGISYIRKMIKRRLYEKHQIQTTGTVLAKYGIVNFNYRHNAYYPTGLKDYIERFGFMTKRHFTIHYFSNSGIIESTLRTTPIIKYLGKTIVMKATIRTH